MVTMMDEIYDRGYQAARKDLNASMAGIFGRFGQAVGEAFEVLVKIEYQAPWAAKSKRARLN
jgi:hypothetical protein